MNNMKIAKELFKEKFLEVLKIFGIEIFLSLIIVIVMGMIPILNLLSVIFTQILTVIPAMEFYKRVVIGNERLNFFSMFGDALDYYGKNTKIISAILPKYLLQLVPIVLGLLFVTMIPLFMIAAMLGGREYAFIFTPGIVPILLALGVVAIYYSYYLNYKYTYAIVAMLNEVDAKEIVSCYKKEIIKLSLKALIFSVIPILNLIIPIVYQIKILLDVGNINIIENVNENTFEI